MKISELPDLPPGAVNPITVAVAGGTSYQSPLPFAGENGGGLWTLVEQISITENSPNILFDELEGGDHYQIYGAVGLTSTGQVLLRVNGLTTGYKSNQMYSATASPSGAQSSVPSISYSTAGWGLNIFETTVRRNPDDSYRTLSRVVYNSSGTASSGQYAGIRTGNDITEIISLEIIPEGGGSLIAGSYVELYKFTGG